VVFVLGNVLPEPLITDHLESTCIYLLSNCRMYIDCMAKKVYLTFYKCRTTKIVIFIKKRKMYIRAALRSIRCKVLCCGLVAVTYIVVVLFNSAPTLRQEKEYPVLEWFRAPTVACGGNWTGFGNEMVVLKNARILNTSAFAVPCTGEIPEYNFRYSEEGPLDEWLSHLNTVDSHLLHVRRQLTLTFVVQRIEAHNLYHTLCEWFNVYMVSKLLPLDASKVDIVFLDHRPKSLLDET